MAERSSRKMFFDRIREPVSPAWNDEWNPLIGLV